MYVVFARKYRPQRFEDVVGQDHIAKTLQNTVKSGRVAHAYLFCGSRGVGKTTVARILAKALNCKEGPTPRPCCQCESCRRIATGDDLDVIEIDGASNRLVEDVEVLRNNVRLVPARSRFKVYYIDEVHMLSGHAFNALLKTLEEPPEHVKFIFST
ncbi:MAG: DNA polymerase III subunit gamma/tau, partial [Candidatus Brocadiae bacterium]|nr:DNA polymerase III subunit gamma/tau [Candidatus Brocadiia bacterium]